jgi:hypothetical protein
MCFSAAASFTGGAVLSAAGVATVKRAHRPNQRLFSLIPLLFAFQQLAEGVIWVTLRSMGLDLLQNTAMYLFLVMALVVWPTLVPLSVWLMEEVKSRKRILTFLVAAGACASLFYIYGLVFYEVNPRIVASHIEYVDAFPRTPVNFVFGLYLAATVLSLFVSSVRRMWVFGGLIAVSLLVTSIFFTHYLTSVWCFFAALSSVAVYFILAQSRKAPPVPQ